MGKTKYTIIIALLIVAIAFSGCAERDAAELIESGFDDAESERVPVDEALIEGMAGVTETEIDELEKLLSELEMLIDDMNIEDIEIEEI